MSDWVRKFKPAASARAQLLAAGCVWTLVGSGLLAAGLYWSRSFPRPEFLLLIATAACLGLLKARIALARTARRITDRICRRGDGRCLGGFLSWRMWLFAASMILLGRVLRASPLPVPVIAFVYQTVGVALLIGAISFWRAYARQSAPA